MVDVRVKPLEWVEINEGKVFRALLPVIGSIRIEPYGVCGWWEVLWSMPGQCDKLIPDVFDTPDEAKAAAQADYERRILSTLSDAVAERETEPVAWQHRLKSEYEEAHWTEWREGKANITAASPVKVEESPLYTSPPTSELEAENERLKAELAEKSGSWVLQRCVEAEERLAEALKALNLIDALDPEEHVYGCSADALRGIVIQMGQIARRVREGGKVDG